MILEFHPESLDFDLIISLIKIKIMEKSASFQLLENFFVQSKINIPDLSMKLKILIDENIDLELILDLIYLRNNLLLKI